MERRCAAFSTAGLRAFDFQIDHDRILTASYHDSFTGFVGTSVDLLVGHVGGNIDKISRPGLTAEFQAVSPSHAGPAANDVKHRFQVAVVVWASLRIWLNYDGAGPEFARSSSGMGDGGCTGHTGCLRSVGVQVSGWYDFDAIMLPVHN